MNLTIIVPEGTTNHGVSNLICLPATWYDYIIFFITNYFAYAATVTNPPGATLVEVCFVTVNALFVPGSGALAAITRLIKHAAWSRTNEICKAAKAGALCMVVKKESLPQMRSSGKFKENMADAFNLSAVQNPKSWVERKFIRLLRATIVPANRKIHGLCDLPSDYCLVEVSDNTPLKPFTRDSTQVLDKKVSDLHLGSSFNFAKALIAVGQGFLGALTLYKAQGDQIARYGVAAFGLSVAPYLFMSVVNSATALVTPEYASMYLVHSPDLDEAEKKGGRFSEIIAAVDLDAIHEPIDFVTIKFGLQYVIWAMFLFLVPLAINGALSHFQLGDESTISQRGWMLSWLCMGILSAPWLTWFKPLIRTWHYAGGSAKILLAIIMMLCVLPCWIPAIGGMVTVGLTIKDYGVCEKLDM